MVARIALAGLVFIGQLAYAGSVRTTAADKASMTPIYLKMGQSTVLRFQDKPRKVVVGNQNYMSIEFIDNDVTIQPQDTVATNLFVYGENHTYGFILTVGHGNYDDLVYVRWAPRIEIKSRPAFLDRKRRIQSMPKIGFKMDRLISGQVERVMGPLSSGVHLVDLEIENITKEKIEMHNFQVILTQARLPVSGMTYGFDKDEILPKQKVRVRVVFKTEEGGDLLLSLKWKDKGTEIKIPGKLL